MANFYDFFIVEKMGVPCPICQTPLKHGEGRSFPTGDARVEFCAALGVDHTVFDGLPKNRYVCLRHYRKEHYTTLADGSVRWNVRNPLPKPLSPDEIHALNPSVSSKAFKRPKGSTKSKKHLHTKKFVVICF
jgi:hypothetical protein